MSVSPGVAVPSERRAGVAARVSDFFAEAERTLPVDEWRIGGLRVWPLLRNYHAFALVTRLEYDANSQIVRYSGGGHRMRQIAGSLADGVLARLRDRAGEQPAGAPADVVSLVASSTRFFRVAGRWYTPYGDGFRGALAARGLSVGVLELATDGVYRVPRHSPSALLQNAVFLRTLGARVAARVRRAEERLEGWDAMVALSDRALGPGRAYSLDALRFRAAQVEALRPLFRRALARARPAVGLLTGYYAADAMAFILACRDVGVRSVEVQHGVQGEWHFAYARWGRVPAGGWELLPDVFWTWDASSRDVIAAWADDTGGAHRAIVGGNPCLQVPDALALPGPGEGAGVRILFTAQAFYGVPEAVQEAMAASPPGWHWWIRVHPQYWETRDALRASLAARGLTNWSLDDASEAPLASLLAASQAHVTEFSSSVLEAEALGVPSVVLHEKGRLLFGPQLASGTARHVTDGATLVRTIAEWAARGTTASGAARRADEVFAQGCDWLAARVEEGRGRRAARS